MTPVCQGSEPLEEQRLVLMAGQACGKAAQG